MNGVAASPAGGAFYKFMGAGWVAAISCDLSRIFKERVFDSSNPRATFPEMAALSDSIRLTETLSLAGCLTLGGRVLSACNLGAHLINLGIYLWGVGQASKEVGQSLDGSDIFLSKGKAHLAQNNSYLNFLSHVCSVAYFSLGVAGVLSGAVVQPHLMGILFLVSTIFYVIALFYQTSHQVELATACELELPPFNA